ncbi:glycosyl transferase family 1 [Nitrospira sp.]|nr:glycosyl transferase family 1 [Nitrospira sp.]
MRIAHISTYDVKGGAALAAYRLHRGLDRLGLDTSMMVKYRSSQDPRVTEFVLPMDLPSRGRRWWRRKTIVRSMAPYAATKPTGFELFSQDRTPYGAALIQQVPPSDIINLHWIAAYVDYELFFPTAATRACLVWTFHDMNPVTGGCHYDMECGKFAQRCGACPQLGSRDPQDLAGEIWDRKRAIFERLDARRLCIVTPSRWLGQVVKQSPIFARFRVETIPYGLDLDDFAPRDRASARHVLGIPEDAQVILFLAEMVDNQRKGFALLTEALAASAQSLKRLWFLSVGNNAPRLAAGLHGSHLNYVGSDRFLSMVYSAADVFVIPSMQDNLPNTVMEAMACGTPVIGFDVGGVRDMVRPDRTGLLVTPGDVGELRVAIERLVNDPPLGRRMGAEARRVAEAEYPLLLQAERYHTLYSELLS